jgi:prepilin-type N-terminal cleavage/methylation domain-containing protein
MKLNRKAFTLIELLVVIVIIGILATISVSTFKGFFEKARLAKSQASAEQIKRLFLAQNASTEANLFTIWYGFDRDGDVNQTSPFLIDKSEAGNNLTREYPSGSGSITQSSETGSGTGKSLHIDHKIIDILNTVPGGPTNKITIATWVKLEEYPSNITYPVYLTRSSGFRIYSDGEISFHINDSADEARSDIPKIILNRWHYIVGSYNGNTQSLKLWVDGDLIAKKENVVQTVPFQGKGFFVGYHENFVGWIDEVMLFPYAFGGEELK